MRSLKNISVEKSALVLFLLVGIRPVPGVCIDVDNIIYNKDPRPLIKKVREKKYPLMPYRSKTGGLHLVLHIKGSVLAADMRAKIHELAADLGCGGEGADKFPAEDEIKWDAQKNEYRQVSV
jgi:hypothetical protein